MCELRKFKLPGSTGQETLLCERYGSTLPKLEAEVEAVSAKVAAHLKKRGIQWN